MRFQRMAWFPLGLAMALGCQQTDRVPEEQAEKPRVSQREGSVPGTSVPRAADPAAPVDARPVEPFAARGPAPTLRIGRRAQPDGRILDSDQTDVFMSYDPIRFSVGLAEVAGGTVARLSVQGQSTKQEVWQSQRSVPAGDSLVAFELGPGKLPPGDYVGVLTLDGRGVSQHAFKVSSN